MQPVLSEQDLKDVERCCILENVLPANEFVKHIGVKKASLQLALYVRFEPRTLDPKSL